MGNRVGATVMIGGAFALAACGGGASSGSTSTTDPPATTPAVTITTTTSATTAKVDAAVLVATHYADCLAKLKATKPKEQTSTLVTATADHRLMSWRIVTRNGKVYTMPADEATVEQLGEAGC